MKSLWAQYITELLGGSKQFIEHEWGFISYSLLSAFPDCIYIEDIYVIPEKRGATSAGELLAEVEAVGAQVGKTASVFAVRTDSPRCVDNLNTYLSRGAVPVDAINGVIWLKRKFTVKGISDGQSS